MFFSMVISVRRKIQADTIYRDFNQRFSKSLRDCRILDSGGSRSLDLVFKADEASPFIEYTQNLQRTSDYVKHDIEFAYDDGQFHSLFIGPDRITEDTSTRFSYSSEYIYTKLFTGREDVLYKLHEYLTSEGAVALTGLGGIGKTQTAVEYAHRNRDEYSEVLWVRADNHDNIIEGYASLAYILDLPDGLLLQRGKS